MTSTPSPQQGIWTLTAPDGRTWQADSPLKAVSAEQRERVPAKVAVERIFAACEEAQPPVLAVPGWRPTSLLAEKHTGMRVDYSGLLGQCQRALARGHSANAEMLSQLQGHLKELGQRWYAGDTAVVDEILQLYCIEKDAREALAAAPAIHEGGEHA